MEPASGGVEVEGGAPHVPVPPAAMLQTNPAQQSPVAVQLPPPATQATPPVPPLGAMQRRVPVESGTHGESPQHSADVLHVWPACRQQFGSLPL